MQDFQKVVDFMLELEKLKGVERRIRPLGQSRFENSAEHSWQVCVLALMLAKDRPELDMLKVLKMLLLHDVVEIDAGDVFVYDDQAREDAFAAEVAAAERIFGLLPDELGQECMAIWLEFEQSDSAEAQFAKGLDRFIPVMQNLNNQGQSWVEHGVQPDQVLTRNAAVEQASQSAWQWMNDSIEEERSRGWFGILADQSGK